MQIDHPLKRRAAAAVDLGLTLVAGPWGWLSGVPRRAEPFQAPRTVLFVRLDHIGDLIMTLPAMALVRREWPEARTIALVAPWSAPLARLAPAIDEVLVLECPWWSRLRGSPPPAAAWRCERRAVVASLRRRGVDLAIDFRGDLRHILHFLWRVRASARLSYTRSGGRALLTHPVEFVRERHEVEQSVELLRALPITGAPPPGPHLREDAAAREAVLRRLRDAGLADRPFALVHPGARTPLKAWPEENFAQAVDHLAEVHGLRSVLVGDAGDAQRCAEVRRLTRAPALDLGGQTSLVEMVSLARAARLFIGNDSGLMHLAAACALPTVALFGPTDPLRYGPFGAPRRVVQQPCPCWPSLLDRCPHSDAPEARCMRDMPLEAVRQAVDELLAETGAG